MDNWFNEVFPSFDSLNPEFRPGNRIIDCFSNCFSFYSFSKNSDCFFKDWIQQLDDIAIKLSNSPLTVLMVTDASVKNNITSSIAHIYVYNKLIVKMLHQAINVTSTEVEFFAIRCSINQALHLQNISKIIVITDSIHMAKKIFNTSSHPLQKQVALILNNLRDFFNKCHENMIKFWECPSKCKWNLHKHIDIESKSFNLTPLFPNKNSWDFSKKSECNNKILEPTYSKDGTWLQYIGHSNILCARATRAITNHALISEYHLHFFPREEFSCLCGLYPIETRHYILHECRRFNEYWNPRKDLVAYFVLFLELNPNVFAFLSCIT